MDEVMVEKDKKCYMCDKAWELLHIATIHTLIPSGRYTIESEECPRYAWISEFKDIDIEFDEDCSPSVNGCPAFKLKDKLEITIQPSGGEATKTTLEVK